MLRLILCDYVLFTDLLPIQIFQEALLIFSSNLLKFLIFAPRFPFFTLKTKFFLLLREQNVEIILQIPLFTGILPFFMDLCY